MTGRRITPTVEGSYTVMPRDIDATHQFWSAFGKAETEFAALGVVLYCQDKGGWVPFTEEELTTFFRAAKASGRIFRFEHLALATELAKEISKAFGRNEKVPDQGAYPLFMTPTEIPWWSRSEPDTFEFLWLDPRDGHLVRKGDDGKYRVTEYFIERCYATSPDLSRN